MTTIKELESLIATINGLTDSPATSYTREEGQLKANVGNYHLSQAYGGVCLHRMANKGGGVGTPLMSYHVPKKELGIALRGFLAGLEFSK